jgi:hypothetical protein
MAIRYFERTGTWEFDSVKEARAFRSEWQGITTSVTRAKPPKLPAEGSPKDAVRKALLLLAAAGSKGLLGGEIAPSVGLKSAKGMPGLAHSITQYLVQAMGDGKAKQTFWKKKSPGRPAQWFVDSRRLVALGLSDEASP